MGHIVSLLNLPIFIFDICSVFNSQISFCIICYLLCYLWVILNLHNCAKQGIRMFLWLNLRYLFYTPESIKRTLACFNEFLWNQSWRWRGEVAGCYLPTPFWLKRLPKCHIGYFPDSEAFSKYLDLLLHRKTQSAHYEMMRRKLLVFLWEKIILHSIFKNLIIGVVLQK